MKEIMETLEYRGVEYPLIINLNVLQELQNKYGSFEAWAHKVLLGNGETDLGALTFGTMAMINEGIDIHNEEHRIFLSPHRALKSLSRAHSQAWT